MLRSLDIMEPHEYNRTFPTMRRMPEMTARLRSAMVAKRSSERVLNLHNVYNHSKIDWNSNVKKHYAFLILHLVGLFLVYKIHSFFFFILYFTRMTQGILENWHLYPNTVYARHYGYFTIWILLIWFSLSLKHFKNYFLQL